MSTVDLAVLAQLPELLVRIANLEREVRQLRSEQAKRQPDSFDNLETVATWANRTHRTLDAAYKFIQREELRQREGKPARLEIVRKGRQVHVVNSPPDEKGSP